MTKDSPHDTHHELDRETIALIDATAGDIRASIDNGRLPKIKLPTRSLNNVDYDKAKGYFRARDLVQGALAQREHRTLVRSDPSPDGDFTGNGRE